MNQTNTHDNNIIYVARCPGRLSLVEKYTGHVRSRVRTYPAPWGMSAQEHTFTFCQIFFISGGNYTLITCIQYTTMVTHYECEISQSWRTQFSSHGALNLNRAVMPPLPLPVEWDSNIITVLLLLFQINNQHKLQVCENNWIRKIAGVRRVERRRMKDLREEVGTKACIVGKIV